MTSYKQLRLSPVGRAEATGLFASQMIAGAIGFIYTP